jgi:O-antigen/teichoic acid export membrane protein|tara:strand:- start:2498 stop:2761 length:264 start_codon:yes stop_codon:yes gene_type:complete
MIVLVVGNWFNVALGSVGILLVMSGHEKVTLWGQLSGFLATVMSAIVLIPPYQAVGAAFSVVIGLVVWNLFLGCAVFKYLGIRPGVL